MPVRIPDIPAPMQITLIGRTLSTGFHIESGRLSVVAPPFEYARDPMVETAVG